MTLSSIQLATDLCLGGVVGYHMRLTRARSGIRTPPKTSVFLGPIFNFKHFGTFLWGI